MFNLWCETDPDCCQHIRSNGSLYEMIQCVWLDTTEEDIALGRHEYCIVSMCIDLNDYPDEEKEMYLNGYGYTLDHLRWAYDDEETVNSIVAECILEESILSNSCIIDHADSFDEAKEKIMKILCERD